MVAPKPNRFDSLPMEVRYQIMEELLTLEKNHGRIVRHPPKQRWPHKLGFQPGIQLQILRVSKSMHAAGTVVLDRSNMWVILDMDCANLLIGWAVGVMDMIIVDPECAQDLPSGLLHIRIKLYAKGSRYANSQNSSWPAAMSDRQIILMPASHLDKLLRAIRIVEFANGVRAMPGQVHRNVVTNEECVALPGRHGMSICVHVNQDYPSADICRSLEYLRMLHGPLNEVSIIGATDEQQARDIERSISLPRDVASNSTFSEVLMHIVDLLALAELNFRKGLCSPVSLLYEQARVMIMNTYTYDTTPWGG